MALYLSCCLAVQQLVRIHILQLVSPACNKHCIHRVADNSDSPHGALLAASAALGPGAKQEQAAASPAAKKAKEEAQAEVLDDPHTSTVQLQFPTLLCHLVHQPPCDNQTCDKAG